MEIFSIQEKNWKLMLMEQSSKSESDRIICYDVFFMLTLSTYMLYSGDCVAYEVLAKGSQSKRGKLVYSE